MPSDRPLGQGGDQVHHAAADQALLEVVREELRRALAPLVARLEAVERAANDAGSAPRASPREAETSVRRRRRPPTGSGGREGQRRRP